MRSHFKIIDRPPLEAREVGNLKIHRFEDHGGKLYVKIWRGKQSKPYAYYRFTGEERREAYIEEQIRDDEGREKLKAERKAEDAKRLAEMVEKIQVGQILHYSWGYDQTQCEYYQVVEKRGRKIVIREIGSEIVPGSEGFMCENRRPCRGKFVGEPLTKIIGPYGIRMDFGGATPVSDDYVGYCSHYA